MTVVIIVATHVTKAIIHSQVICKPPIIIIQHKLLSLGDAACSVISDRSILT